MSTGATEYLRGWPIYWNADAEEWRFIDNDAPTVSTWADRPCGYCGLHGSSAHGDPDPCLGELAGVTNACCGHGNPEESYIVFMGGLVIRGFDIDEFHHRTLSEDEQGLIRKHNDKRQKFRTLPNRGDKQ